MESTKTFEIGEDLRQSSEYGEYMKRIGWRVEKYHVSGIKYHVFIRRLLGLVSIAKVQRTSTMLPGLEEILRKDRVVMCKVEPREGSLDSARDDIEKRGFRLDGWPLLASKTLRVDLRPSEEKILESFDKDTRYCIRQVSNHKPQTTINNYDGFYEIWKKSSKRKNLWIPSKKDYNSLIECFGKKVFSVCIDNNAGALILIHDKCAYYYYAGATKEGNKNNLPYAVVWEAMKIAKKKGCKIWDFEGIYDSRFPNKGWLGFTRFKKGFGGREIEFAGSYKKWRLPN